ncbi:MAG: UDP-glucose 4-epimerase GalE [Candidatus Marithrix sp.]
MNNKILVTGGTGYIGSHTVVELQNKGFEVIIIDNLSNSKIEVLDGIEEITGKRPEFECVDLTDTSQLSVFFKKYSNISSVIHFAAFKAVGESVQNPLKYYSNNLISLINLLNQMKIHAISGIVFSSSCTVYGQPDKLPVSENSPIQLANSPYGNTKQICEEIIRDSILAKLIDYCISLRYFNPIGAHPSAIIGELPLGAPNNLIPYITQTAIGLKDQLKVFGNNYNTPDGTCIRDYINVTDLAKAHVVSVERLFKKNSKESFEVFNLGTGKGVSVMEIIKTFEKTSQHSLNYKIVERREGDVEQIWADTSYANKELGWKAETNLEDTILSSWKWEQYIRTKHA